MSTSRFDLDGRLHIEGGIVLAKSGVVPFRGGELAEIGMPGLEPLRVFSVLRRPHIFADAVMSFAGTPIVTRHPGGGAVDATDVVGAVGTKTEYRHPFLVADGLVIWSADAIRKALSGAQSALSIGYQVDGLAASSGIYEGVRFDFEMAALRADHVALVRSSRGGAAVKLDIDIDNRRAA